MEEVLVYKSGTRVVTIVGDVAGMITCSSIRFKEVRYEISYFLAGVYTNVWLNEDEFEVTTDEKIKVGYK